MKLLKIGPDCEVPVPEIRIFGILYNKLLGTSLITDVSDMAFSPVAATIEHHDILSVHLRLEIYHAKLIRSL